MHKEFHGIATFQIKVIIQLWNNRDKDFSLSQLLLL